MNNTKGKGLAVGMLFSSSPIWTRPTRVIYNRETHTITEYWGSTSEGAKRYVLNLVDRGEAGVHVASVTVPDGRTIPLIGF